MNLLTNIYVDWPHKITVASASNGHATVAVSNTKSDEKLELHVGNLTK